MTEGEGRAGRREEGKKEKSDGTVMKGKERMGRKRLRSEATNLKGKEKETKYSSQ